MTIKKLFSNVVKNQGATIDYKKHQIKSKYGYMVSLADYETKTSININDFKKYFKQYKRLLKRLKKTYKKLYIGFWIDKNILYIDLSIYTNNLVYAIDEAIKNKQLAIYDLNNNKSVYIKL